LADRLFAACDRTAPGQSAFTVALAPGRRLGGGALAADTDHVLTVEWTGTGRGAVASVTLDGKPAGELPLRNAAPNGLSYLHVIADGDKPGPAIQLERASAEVR
jgi:hypothetical protein